jgi:hypothetical protein
MYEINMLKERQLPGNHWLSMAALGVAFVVPLVLAFIMSMVYFEDKASLAIEQEALSDYEFQLREFDDARKRVDSIVLENQQMSASLSDVVEVLGRHSQWTDILLTISHNLPDTLRVNKLDVIGKMVTRTVDQRYGDKKKINISVPTRTLVVSLYSVSADGNDAAVRDFQRSLMVAEVFQECVKDVMIALREPDKIQGNDVVRYELNCVLNTKLRQKAEGRRQK